MNTVLDEAEEIYLKKGNRKKLGRIILKGDSISLICNVRYIINIFKQILYIVTYDEYLNAVE
jgi:hypothetical protein